MSIKILGGSMKGFPIKVLEHPELRPTSVMLRRKIFDAHQDLSGYHFVDLCAGSGAVGLEALSRGSETVSLVEPNKSFSHSLRQTVKKIEKRYPQFNQQRLKIYSKEAFEFLKMKDIEFSGPIILFFDPPYHQRELYQNLKDWIFVQDYKGKLWLEGDHHKGEAVSFWTEAFSELNPDFRIYKSSSHYIIAFDFGL